MGKTLKKVTSVSLPPALAKTLNDLAREKRVTRSQLIERYCEEAIDRERLVASAFRDEVVTGAFLRAFSEPGMLRRLAASMSEDLSDEQLNLFTRAVEEASRSGQRALQHGKQRKKKQST